MAERQREGIAIAKAKGKYKGRKWSLTPHQVTEVAARLGAGGSTPELAREYRVSVATVYNCRARAQSTRE